MKLTLFSLAVLPAVAFAVNGAEYKAGANIYAPFKHQPYYRGEREQLGYKPEYPPNLITFDDANVPFIRDGEGFINTLNEVGKWIKLDFKPFIKKVFPKWDGKLFNGPFADERIVFDREGHAYTHVIISRRSPQSKSLILYSTDKCRSWQVYELPKKFNRGWFAKLEDSAPMRRLSTPPVLSMFNGKTIYILPSVKIKNGLRLGKPVLVANHAAMVSPHSGGGNFTATIPGKTFIVYAGLKPVAGKVGTPQYIISYDHATGRCGLPTYIANNGYGEIPDPHNLPTILLDSKGYVHVLLGSHHDPFVYIRSLKPYDLSSWTEPEELGSPKTKMAEGSYTYIGIVCDKFDNLHLTARWAGEGYKNKLIYMKKPAGKSWLPQKILVEPFKTLYSCFYHKMSQDLYGRVFVSYYYYGNELSPEMAKAYDKKWPEHKILAGGIHNSPNGHFYKVKNNDPVTLITNDSGESFRLALSDDFSYGRIRKAVSGKERVNSIGMPLIAISAGEFIMGSLNGAYDEKPLRPVKISKSFEMGKYPVRVKDFAAFVKDSGYQTEFEKTANKKLIYSWCGGKFPPGDERSWKNPKMPQTPDNPVVILTYGDMLAFCKWLSKKENCVYRLPTEAEWEYACRAGSITEYYFGGEPDKLPRYGWYKVNATGTKPVGMLLPNAFGLFDMSGNVWEYCSDYYQPKRSDLPVVDPLYDANKIFGPNIRGGSWLDDRFGHFNGFNLRSACRYHSVYPLIQLDWAGFRIVKENK